MKVSVVGSGYVGSVTAACLAELGNDVVCADVDERKVRLLNSGKAPIYEPGLDELVRRNVARRRLSATTDLEGAVSGSELTFICVGTPSKRSGETDLSFVHSAARGIGKALRKKRERHLVVVKSTVPPGTCETLIPLIARESGKKAGRDFGVASNPEFLREGNAVADFFEPDRIVVGTNNRSDERLLLRLYSGIKAPILRTNTRTAEMIKYASNAFLAAKVSFINEVANICERLGIDVYDVAEGMGHDKRIGRRFLNAGAGFGGSCFPKDVRSLSFIARSVGYTPRVIEAILGVNERQPLRMVEMARKELGGLKGKRIAVLGLAFKPDTDDVREAPALKIILALVREGARVAAYDPAAEGNARKVLGRRGITYAGSVAEALRGADACLIVTEWREFSRLGSGDFRTMRNPLVIEGRRILRSTRMKGVRYRGIGRIPYG